MLETKVLERLKKSYLRHEHEELVLQIDCTRYLLRIVHDVSTNSINLSSNQVEDLLGDINTIKALNLWDYGREQKIIKKLNEDHAFYKELKKLPEAEWKRYFRELEKGGIFEL